jgi:pSer/pThr/pTyr-binding forkhead associated (FHA) protein
VTTRHTPSAEKCVFVHLLDSVQGHPLQTWRFANRESITIGRSEESDVVVANPQVSRTHATLVHAGGFWTLLSTGRHGTIIDSRVVSEHPLRRQTVFQLGSGGPLLRFDADGAQPNRSETLDAISPEALLMLQVDDERKQAEVEQIADNDLFRNLLEQSRQLRRRANAPSSTHNVDDTKSSIE